MDPTKQLKLLRGIICEVEVPSLNAFSHTIFAILLNKKCLFGQELLYRQIVPRYTLVLLRYGIVRPISLSLHLLCQICSHYLGPKQQKKHLPIIKAAKESNNPI